MMVYIIENNNNKFIEAGICYLQLNDNTFVHKLLANDFLNWGEKPTEEELLVARNNINGYGFILLNDDEFIAEIMNRIGGQNDTN